MVFILSNQSELSTEMIFQVLTAAIMKMVSSGMFYRVVW
jgi:hypothetical protein